MVDATLEIDRRSRGRGPYTDLSCGVYYALSTLATRVAVFGDYIADL